MPLTSSSVPLLLHQPEKRHQEDQSGFPGLHWWVAVLSLQRLQLVAVVGAVMHVVV